MKKILLLISLFAIFSCTKEEDNFNQSSDSLGFNKIIYNSNSRNPGTEILAFNSVQDYENMVSQLENEVELWDDAFVSEWNHLDEDDLDLKEEELNFDDEKPLTDFEIQNDFYSLRNKYYEEENQWLNNEVLDETKDPNDKAIYDFDEVEMAIMNPNGEIKIGEKIYKFLESGTLKINDGDFEKLVRFNNGDMTVLEDPNVEFETRTDYVCDAWRSNPKYFYYNNNNRRVKLKTKIRSVTHVLAKLKAKIISYKKRNNGTWKRKRIWLKVGVQSRSYCSGIDRYAWSGYKHKKRKKLKKTLHLWDNPGHLRAQKYTGSVEGRFQFAGYAKGLYLWGEPFNIN